MDSIEIISNVYRCRFVPVCFSEPLSNIYLSKHRDCVVNVSQLNSNLLFKVIRSFKLINYDVLNSRKCKSERFLFQKYEYGTEIADRCKQHFHRHVSGRVVRVLLAKYHEPGRSK